MKTQQKTTGTKSAVWDRIATMRPKRPTVPPNAFSVKEYMAKFGLTVGQAKVELAKLVTDGLLETEIDNGAGHAGHPARMYWPAEVKNGTGIRAR